MKKTVFSLMLMLAVAGSVSAQSWKDLLGKAASEVVSEVSSTNTGSAVTNVLGALLGNSLTLSDAALEGTWDYEGVACILESENALSNLGGSLVTGTLESKLDGLFSKVGISKGQCSFTFVKDGTCVINVKGFDLPGKYELNAEEKVIVFSFMYDSMPVKTYVAYEIQNLNVVFKADRLLGFIKNVVSYLSKSGSGVSSGEVQALTSTVGTIGSLLNNYDGMMLGAKLKKSGVSNEGSAASGNAGSAVNSTGEKVLKGLGGLFK